MSVQWYYRTGAGDVGPISGAEFKYLIDKGTIGASTLVRAGDDGSWVAANKVWGLPIATPGGRDRDGAADQVPEWHFSLKGQTKQGPVSLIALKAMVVDGHLQFDDLVWKPGMALWVPAGQVSGLIDKPVGEAITDPSRWSSVWFSGRPAVRRASLAAVVLLVLLAAVGAWKWAAMGTSKRSATGAGDSPHASDKYGPVKDKLGGVEPLLAEARTAVRLQQFERAIRTLNQYLASPQARQVDAAKVLLREITLATSASEAARVASNLDDGPLRNYLQNGVDALVSALATPDLRPIYEQTLLRAFRQENNRRQMIPRVAIAQPHARAGRSRSNRSRRRCGAQRAAAARLPEPAEQPKVSILGPAGLARKAPGGNADLPNDNLERLRRPGPVPADVDDVVAKPGEFVGGTLVLNGLFKIGTKITEVKGPDGQVLGWSLPVARDDDTAVCSVDGKVSRQDAYLLLDDRLATFLAHVFRKLRLKPTIKPTYKCILTVTIRRLLVNGSPTPVVVISSMEVLGGCDYLASPGIEYAEAFRTLKVTPDEADVDFGDGDLWVNRLGGEENFVQADQATVPRNAAPRLPTVTVPSSMHDSARAGQGCQHGQRDQSDRCDGGNQAYDILAVTGRSTRSSRAISQGRMEICRKEGRPSTYPSLVPQLLHTR